MKTHATVTVTKKMLKQMNACSGIKVVQGKLPLKISTDPEKNVEVAEALIGVGADISWFFRTINAVLKGERCECGCGSWFGSGSSASVVDVTYPDSSIDGSIFFNAYVTAQWLANAADVIDTNRAKFNRKLSKKWKGRR